MHARLQTQGWCLAALHSAALPPRGNFFERLVARSIVEVKTMSFFGFCVQDFQINCLNTRQFL